MGEVTKTQLNVTNESQEVSSFKASDHKAAMNRRESMTNRRLERRQRVRIDTIKHHT